MRYSIGFLQGFEGGDALRADGFTDHATLPDTLTLVKGDAFKAWLTDEMRVVLDKGPIGEVPAWVMNRHKVHELLDAWLDGVEFDG